MYQDKLVTIIFIHYITYNELSHRTAGSFLAGRYEELKGKHVHFALRVYSICRSVK